MKVSRRWFVTGTISAPAVIAYGHLMPVKRPPLIVARAPVWEAVLKSYGKEVARMPLVPAHSVWCDGSQRQSTMLNGEGIAPCTAKVTSWELWDTAGLTCGAVIFTHPANMVAGNRMSFNVPLGSRELSAIG
jgi:hypothetical protein